MSDSLADWATGLMDTLGAPGAGIAVALENLFPPLPSEVILPLAGFTAGRGRMDLLDALVWTTLGSVVGALALYWIGALLGRERLYAIAERVPLLKVSDIERTEAFFARHGGKTVFFGRMVPVFRSLISIPAGVERMPLGRFLLLTTLGSGIWNSAFVLAGYFLGEQWGLVEGYVNIGTNVVLGVVAVAVLVFVAVRLAERSRGRHAQRGRDGRGGGERALRR
ncbi:DedA family protein [Thermoactinospora rubra]|uniref:DedA family protein n=1 Tax=Thermoactinospora rubra TaxID=1088767 RepID=UPI000A11685D|nr:DedA family protein [Thermoactinospora rubra]